MIKRTCLCYTPVTMRESSKIALVFCVTVALDRFLSHFFAVPGLTLAEPITIIAVSTAVAAAAGTTAAVMNYEASQRAEYAQEGLRNQQASALKAQQEARAALARKQASGGNAFGYAPGFAESATGLGFGSGRADTGYGRGRLVGG